MRLTLTVLAVLVVTAIFSPSVRAQASIPYRRTIPYLSNRPYQPSGRYVRLNVSMGGPRTSSFGRSTNSLAIQATINVPVSGDSARGTPSATDADNDRRAAGGR